MFSYSESGLTGGPREVEGNGPEGGGAGLIVPMVLRAKNSSSQLKKTFLSSGDKLDHWITGSSSPSSIASSFRRGWDGEATKSGRVAVRTGGALVGGGSEALTRRLALDDLEGGGGGGFFFQSRL